MSSKRYPSRFESRAVGLLNFSRTGSTVVNVVIFLLFLVLFGLEGVRGRIKASKVFVKSAKVLGFAVVALAAGELVAFVCGKIAGVAFKPFGIMQGIMFDNVVMAASVAVMFCLCMLAYCLARAKAVRAVSGSMRASAVRNAAKKHPPVLRIVL